MDIQEFAANYSLFKDADKIVIECEHESHKGEREITIGKQPAKRNIMKNGKNICRDCSMYFDNPMNKKGERRQTNEIIDVICTDPQHEGDRVRQMKKSGYFGPLVEPYSQICGSCIQRGKVISEEQKAKISATLTGIERSDEFKKKISDYMKNNPEHRKKATEILLANHCNTGMLGKHHSDEWKRNMSEMMSGRVYSEEHRQNIAVGRKKMLEEQGGFTVEHRERISKATVRQYQNGFNPNLHHITGYHKSNKVPNGIVFFRSSYEKKAYMLLDDDNSVDSYKSEAIVVEYVKPDDNIVSNFIVDILVTYTDGSQKWIEVKPEAWLDNAVIMAKHEAARLKSRDAGVDFEVWTEMKLFGHVYNKKNMESFIDKIIKGEV